MDSLYAAWQKEEEERFAQMDSLYAEYDRRPPIPEPTFDLDEAGRADLLSRSVASSFDAAPRQLIDPERFVAAPSSTYVAPSRVPEPPLLDTVPDARPRDRTDRDMQFPHQSLDELRETQKYTRQERELGLAEGALRSAARFPGTLVEGAGGSLEALTVQAERALPDVPDLGLRGLGRDRNYLRDLGRVIGDTGQRMIEAFPRSPSQTGEHPFRDAPLQFIAENLPEQAMQIGTQFATGGGAAKLLGKFATGVRSAKALKFAGWAAPTAALETGGTFRAALERHTSEGMDYDEASRMAAQEALLAGAGNTALEYLPFVRFMDKVMPGAGTALHKAMVAKLGRFATGALTGGGVESFQEGLQEVWSSVAADWAGKDPEAWKQIWGRIGTSAMLAMMVGGGAGVITAPAAVPEPGILSDPEGRIIYPDDPTIGPETRVDDLGRPIATTVPGPTVGAEDPWAMGPFGIRQGLEVRRDDPGRPTATTIPPPVIEPAPTAIPAPTVSRTEEQATGCT